ncbi:MAG: RNA-binding transcriptional accessory protein [Oceanospirillales bacterium]|nr:MAG: RNA-binding transcriptional accessory protein [Oceanospirillales bacterium]
MNLAPQLASRLKLPIAQVSATLKLIEEGSTIPFIARYRKEATGGLDDTQLRELAEQLEYCTALEERRSTILDQIRSQDKLTPELEKALKEADSKARLEDLYLPYKPKRRNKAQEAREAGLAGLAEQVLKQPRIAPESFAPPYVDPAKGVDSIETALEGCRHILLEQLTEHPDLIGLLRQKLWQQGLLEVSAAKGKTDPDSKFRDYYAFSETLSKIPSHRTLAILRGKQLGELSYKVNLPEDQADQPLQAIARYNQLRLPECSSWLLHTIEQSWKTKLAPMLENELLRQLRQQAEVAAIDVFARNLKDLLLSAPAGAHVTLGLDPGLRTGVKAAIVDTTGQLLDTATLYPHPPQRQEEAASKQLAELIKRHKVTLIAIGNGTASRETQRWVQNLLRATEFKQIACMLVSEAGASVYSASALAAEEFPNLDVTLRGAVSIARRLQDPLAELVKIDPRAIGVGQYQHDVDQKALATKLDAVVEDCVNHVGVDLNTASPALLTRVAGLNTTLANNIIKSREELGRFADRKQLLKVPRLGPKAFEQCAGFLRIREGKEPLDNTAVHPESYPLVRKIASLAGMSISQLLKSPETLRKIPAESLQEYGTYTLKDVLNELEKPGRDPRPEFRSVNYDDRVESIDDLQIGMRLEGVVTNITNFGAFVDLGVHQDGLVHISQMADSFVKDPHSIVSTGQIVSVKVIEVDSKRRRIALSMKKSE